MGCPISDGLCEEILQVNGEQAGSAQEPSLTEHMNSLAQPFSIYVLIVMSVGHSLPQGQPKKLHD